MGYAKGVYYGPICPTCGNSQENGDLSGTLNSLVGLVAKQDEYIELLTEEGRECAVIASVHGWKTTRFGLGAKLREEIKRLREESNK